MKAGPNILATMDFSVFQDQNDHWRIKFSILKYNQLVFFVVLIISLNYIV